MITRTEFEFQQIQKLKEKCACDCGKHELNELG